MTVGAQRQAHAPSQTTDTDRRDARVEALLTEPTREAPQTERLDFATEFTALSDAVQDVDCFAGAASLLCEDFFESRVCRAEDPDSFTITVSVERLARMQWVFRHSTDLARTARDALEALEVLVSFEGIQVPVKRRSREAQS